MLASWEADDTVDVGFVIAPRFTAGADAFAAWARSIGDAHRDVFLVAPFHPQVSEPAGPIQFLRQTPDPTVQLVRRIRLDEIRAEDPPHYRDIFNLDLRDLAAEKAPRTVAASVLAHNERMIDREGRAEIRGILDDIRQDRDQTYAKILPGL